MTKRKAQEEEKEWDDYWVRKNTNSQFVYRIIASFYRTYIIKKAVNHFLAQEFTHQTDRLLHAGAGSGQVDEDVAKKYHITALDISAEALKLYKQNNGKSVTTMKANIFSIPSKDATYDGVYNLGVMEHFTKDEDISILKELQRVLKPNGKIILFWPPQFGPSVIFLNSAHFILNKIFKKNIRLHPEEISLVQSKAHVEEVLRGANLQLKHFYYGPKDLFTHCIIVAVKPQTKKMHD